MRSLPGQEKRRLARKGRTRVRTASIIPSGRRWRRPPFRTKIARVSGLVGTRRSPRPTARHSASPSGFWARIESGPASMTNPSVVSVHEVAPHLEVALPGESVLVSVRGGVSVTGLARPLRDRGIETLVVGDALAPRRLADAVADGAAAGRGAKARAYAV